MSEKLEMKRVKIASTQGIYTPGVYRWVREAVAPFDQKHAREILEGLGLDAHDAKLLSDHKFKVASTVEGESLVLEFES